MTQTPPDESPAREPIFNAPWPILVLLGAIIGSYAAQLLTAPGDLAALRGGFSVPALEQGRWWTLLTSMFVHGGWTHALMNGFGALAFGAPAARLLGGGVRGASVFFGFFLICGVISSLGFGLLHPDSPALLIGASGAVSGLMGAASRLFDRPGALAPILSRTPIGFAVAWIVANLLLAVTGLTPGMAGAVVAWEAHLIGFAAGLLLIGPAARLARPL